MNKPSSSIPQATLLAQVSAPPGRKRQRQHAAQDDEHDPLRAPFDKAVTVQPHSQDEVDSVPGHDDRQEAADGRRHQAERADPSGKSAVKRDEIDEKRDERPDFLGVPSPESAPGIVGPDAAQDRAGGDQEHADLHRPVDEVGERLDDRQQSPAWLGPAASSLTLTVPFFFSLQQVLGAESHPIQDLAAHREKPRERDRFPEQGDGGEEVEQGVPVGRGLRA